MPAREQARVFRWEIGDLREGKVTVVLALVTEYLMPETFVL